MAGRLTPLGLFVKWFLIPAMLAAIGYFLIGPHLGKGVLDRLAGQDKPKGPSVEVEAEKLP